MGGQHGGPEDSAGDHPRSRSQGPRRGYGSTGSPDPAGPADSAGTSGSRPAAPRGYGAASGPAHGSASPAPAPAPMSAPAPVPVPAPSPGSGGGRRGYGSGDAPGHSPGSSGSLPRSAHSGGGRRGYGSSAAGAPSPAAAPDHAGAVHLNPTVAPNPIPTVAPNPGPAAAANPFGPQTVIPTPQRSRVEERRATRNGARGRGAGQPRSDRYPQSALNGRSTRNGAAALRARLEARGINLDRIRSRTRSGAGAGGGAGASGPVTKTGYRRYFDYPRTGLRGWRQFVPSLMQVCGGVLACFFLMIAFVAYEYESVQIPDPHSATLAQQSSFMYDDGTTTFATEGSSNRSIVDYSAIPMSVQNAVVAQEDKTFWTNPGVSYTGTARALITDLLGGSTQGGSTITQQYVKQAFLTEAQTTSRKVDEIFIALKLAKMYDKQTIMADYLNTSPFGRDTSGIAAGAKAWFGITLAQMNAETKAQQADQAAFLAAMVNSPTTYSSGWDPSVGAATENADRALALTRWKDTLANMRLYNYISATDYTWAVAHVPQPLPLNQVSGQSMTDVQMKQAALSWLSSYESANPGSGLPTVAQIQQGGYTVVTTFDKTYMQYANQAVTTELLSKENSVDKATLQAGLAAVDPSTGDLVAFYGGNTYENNATVRTEQAGSTFKAFTLATAFSQNWSTNSFISGSSPWPDTTNPTEVAEDQGSPKITNDDGNHGMLTLQQATDASVNTAFIRIEEQVQGGYQAVRATAGKFGLTDADMNTNDQWDSASGCDNVRFTLGVCFTDPARMADAYSVFAADGTYHPLTEVLKVVDNTSGQIYQVHQASTTAIDANTAADVTQMFQGVIHNSDGTAHAGYEASGLNLNNIAGKTGTGTMDLTPTTAQAERAAGYSADACNGACGTGGVWFDGYSSKIAISVGISRWQDITVNGKQEAVQIPVDDIDGSGAAYGAQFPFSIWASFLKQMQGTSFGGDSAFGTASSVGSIMNSPTPGFTPGNTGRKQASPGVPGQPSTAPTRRRHGG